MTAQKLSARKGALSGIDLSPIEVNLVVYFVIIFQATGGRRKFTYLRRINDIYSSPFCVFTKNIKNSSNVGIKPGLALFLKLFLMASWRYLKDGFDLALTV